jgi:hypothetical protein
MPLYLFENLKDHRVFLAQSVLPMSESIRYRTYTINFSLKEDPVSEKGNWINGKTDGVDWVDQGAPKGTNYNCELKNFAATDDKTRIPDLNY